LQPDKEVLKQFKSLRDLSEQQLEMLAQHAEMRSVRKGTLLIKCGSQDDFSLFLVEGTLKLTAADGRISLISSGHPSALVPISQLLPRKYDVVCATRVTYITIDQQVMARVLASKQAPVASGSYLVSGDEEIEESEFEHQLVQQCLSDLENDKLVLPSLPDVAIRIGRALRDEVTDAHQIAEIIQTDPVIAAKLIKAANSALYAGRSPVETCTAAVVRLGSDVTHNLVIAYAVGELFKSPSAILQKMMHELWAHSVKVGAICYVLAKHDPRFRQDQAMLIGLLHDIGVVAVLNYAQKFPEVASDRQTIKYASQRLRAQIGSLILRKWGFPPDFIITALEAEDWLRDSGPEADYCDLVVIAQLHSFMGTDKALSTPGLDEIPARNKLSLGELTPEMSLYILEESKEQIAHAESLFALSG
jgi:HD-like signal output (HDOD) protein